MRTSICASWFLLALTIPTTLFAQQLPQGDLGGQAMSGPSGEPANSAPPANLQEFLSVMQNDFHVGVDQNAQRVLLNLPVLDLIDTQGTPWGIATEISLTLTGVEWISGSLTATLARAHAQSDLVHAELLGVIGGYLTMSIAATGELAIAMTDTSWVNYFDLAFRSDGLVSYFASNGFPPVVNLPLGGGGGASGGNQKKLHGPLAPFKCPLEGTVYQGAEIDPNDRSCPVHRRGLAGPLVYLQISNLSPQLYSAGTGEGNTSEEEAHFNLFLCQESVQEDEGEQPSNEPKKDGKTSPVKKGSKSKPALVPAAIGGLGWSNANETAKLPLSPDGGADSGSGGSEDFGGEGPGSSPSPWDASFSPASFDGSPAGYPGSGPSTGEPSSPLPVSSSAQKNIVKAAASVPVRSVPEPAPASEQASQRALPSAFLVPVVSATSEEISASPSWEIVLAACAGTIVLVFLARAKFPAMAQLAKRRSRSLATVAAPKAVSPVFLAKPQPKGILDWSRYRHLVTDIVEDAALALTCWARPVPSRLKAKEVALATASQEIAAQSHNRLTARELQETLVS